MLCIAAFLAVAGAVGYPFLPWMRLFNVKSDAVAAEGAKAFLVLYGSFVVSVPLGVIIRAQAGLQKGYTSQIVSALGNILSLAAMLVVIWASRQPGMARVRLRLCRHHCHRVQWLVLISAAPLADVPHGTLIAEHRRARYSNLV